MGTIVNRKVLSIFAVAVFLVSVLAVPLVLAVPTPVRTYDPYAKGNGQAGKSNIAHLYLVEKNPSDWMIVPDGAWGKMKYNLAGPTFDFVFNGHGLEPDTSYTLIYYADPWPGNNPGAYIASGTSDNDGNIHLAGSVDLGTDIPNPSDGNYPLGGKIWLVLSNDYNSGNAQTGPMTGWNPTEYLFEYDLIKYDDTDV